MKNSSEMSGCRRFDGTMRVFPAGKAGLNAAQALYFLIAVFGGIFSLFLQK
jgi:hypothetical protein